MLSIWWIKLGIEPVRIEPGKPQQNGRHERIHRTMLIEMGGPAQDEMGQRVVLARFRQGYNEERPHEALGQRPPAMHYVVSKRPMPKGDLPSPTYEDMTIRWVSKTGTIGFAGHVVRLTQCLAREPVGLRQCDSTQWEVFYGPILLGHFDERDGELRRLYGGRELAVGAAAQTEDGA